MRQLLVRTGLLAGVLLLAGCTTLPGTTSASQSWGGSLASHSLPLSEQLSAMLAESNDYAVVTTEGSPWGEQAELHLSPIYYAASGRLCREFEVFTPVQPDKAMAQVACEVRPGQWVSTRNVTRELSTRKLR